MQCHSSSDLEFNLQLHGIASEVCTTLHTLSVCNVNVTHMHYGHRMMQEVPGRLVDCLAPCHASTECFLHYMYDC